MLSVVDRAGSDVISGGQGGVRCYQWWTGRGQRLSVVDRAGSDVISDGQGGVRGYQWWTGWGHMLSVVDWVGSEEPEGKQQLW